MEENDIKIYNLLSTKGTTYALVAPLNAKLPFIVFHNTISTTPFGLKNILNRTKSRYNISFYTEGYLEGIKLLQEVSDMFSLYDNISIYGINSSKEDKIYRCNMDVSLYT